MVVVGSSDSEDPWVYNTDWLNAVNDWSAANTYFCDKLLAHTPDLVVEAKNIALRPVVIKSAKANIGIAICLGKNI